MHLTYIDLLGLIVLAIPIACISRTVVYEEVFRESREYCKRMCAECRTAVQRKFFYLFTCEYCFSHWVTLGVLFITRFQLMYEGWRGYLVAYFALVFVANVYLALYSRLRMEITLQRKSVEAVEKSEGGA